VRRRQRNSPDWTDANVHDPGISLLELFAFLGETLDYREKRTRRRRLALAALVIVAIWGARRGRD
jgi:hypothetical protein